MNRGTVPIRGYGERWMVGNGRRGRGSYERGRWVLGGKTEPF